MDNPELLKRFDDIIGEMKGKRVGLVFDTDADGMTSAVLTSFALEQLGAKVVLATVQSERGGALGLDILQKIPKYDLDLLITLDKPIDQQPDRVEEALQHCRLIVIDHHTINADIDSENCLFIKAQFLDPDFNPSQYPTARMVFDLFSRHVDLTNLDWVCAAGIIADASYKSHTDFINGILRKYNLKIPDDIFKSKIAGVAKLINNVLIFDKRKANDIFKELKSAKKYEDFLSSNLTQYEGAVQDEMEFWLNSAPEKAEHVDELELVWYPIKPKFRIGSPVSTIISMKKYPDKSVIIIQDLGKDDVSMSFRRQDSKVNMAEMAKVCTEGLENANGGGHIPAAGGCVMKKDFETFKARVWEYLRTHLPT